MEVEAFLSKEQEQQIIEAIKVAESHTSGEIRVHLEKKVLIEPLIRAEEVFYYLKMDMTKNENGVLFYVAVDDHQFAILGDRGIDKLVPDDFWESIKEEVLQEFKKGDPTTGLINGILHAGEKLKEFFPVEDDDQNELSNDISRNY